MDNIENQISHKISQIKSYYITLIILTIFSFILGTIKIFTTGSNGVGIDFIGIFSFFISVAIIIFLIITLVKCIFINKNSPEKGFKTQVIFLSIILGIILGFVFLVFLIVIIMMFQNTTINSNTNLNTFAKTLWFLFDLSSTIAVITFYSISLRKISKE